MVIRVFVIGLGQMGISHALAYHNNPDFKIVALMNRSAPKLPPELLHYPLFTDLEPGKLKERPELVCIATHADSHYKYARYALEADHNVFVEKPIATTIEQAEELIYWAKRRQRKLIVGHILRHHPAYQKFVLESSRVDHPVAMRMNLNQRSSGNAWKIHKTIMQHSSPVVDCGPHYVDLMLQITRGARPKQVHAIGVRLSDEIPANQYNYTKLQITFDDGSVGWYEAAWGPMVSETACFVKDVIGPKGSISIVGAGERGSAEVEGHTDTAAIKINLVGKEEEIIEMKEEDRPDHHKLCELQQQFVLDAIEKNLPVYETLDQILDSLKIVLAADESMRTGRVVELK